MLGAEVHVDYRHTEKTSHWQLQLWHRWVMRKDAIQHSRVIHMVFLMAISQGNVGVSFSACTTGVKCFYSTSKGPVKVVLQQSPNKPLNSIFRDKIKHQSDWFLALYVIAEQLEYMNLPIPPFSQVWAWACVGGWIAKLSMPFFSQLFVLNIWRSQRGGFFKLFTFETKKNRCPQKKSWCPDNETDNGKWWYVHKIKSIKQLFYYLPVTSPQPFPKILLNK